MSKYDLSGTGLYETPYDPDFDFHKTMKEVIVPDMKELEAAAATFRPNGSTSQTE